MQPILTLGRLCRAVLACMPLLLVAADGDCDLTPTSSGCTSNVDCQGGAVSCDPPAYPTCSTTPGSTSGRCVCAN